MHPSNSAPVAIFATLLLAPAASASEDVHGARTSAMGRTAAAHPEDDSAVTVNPAAMGLRERYDADGQLRLGGDGIVAAGGSAVDSRTAAPVAFGLTYLYDRSNPPLSVEDLPGWLASGETLTNYQNTHLATAALAVPMLDRRLSFGINGTVRFFDHEHTGQGISHDYDAGLAVAPVDALSVGVVLRSFIPSPGDPLDLGPTVLSGVDLHGEAGALGLDVETALGPTTGQALSLRTGGELRPGVGRIRAGFRYEGATEQPWLSWGLGADNENSGFEYSMSLPLGSIDAFGDLVHQIGLRLRT